MHCCVSYFYGHSGKTPDKGRFLPLFECHHPTRWRGHGWECKVAQFLIPAVSDSGVMVTDWQEAQTLDRNQGPTPVTYFHKPSQSPKNSFRIIVHKPGDPVFKT